MLLNICGLFTFPGADFIFEVLVTVLMKAQAWTRTQYKVIAATDILKQPPASIFRLVSKSMNTASCPASPHYSRVVLPDCSQ